MAIQLSTKQKIQKANADVIGHLIIDEDHFDKLAIDSYVRIERFKTGEAIMADRQTLKIRLCAGAQRLEDFEHDGADLILQQAWNAVNGYNPQVKREKRQFTEEQTSILKQAMDIVDEVLRNSTLWECVQAYKYGEDKCLIDSDKTEYVLLTIH